MKQVLLRGALFLIILAGIVIPTGAAQALPGPETLSGWLAILWGDGRDGSTQTQAFLTTDQGERIQLESDAANLRAFDRRDILHPYARPEGKHDLLLAREGEHADRRQSILSSADVRQRQPAFRSSVERPGQKCTTHLHATTGIQLGQLDPAFRHPVWLL